jgi:hypothetical protein
VHSNHISVFVSRWVIASGVAALLLSTSPSTRACSIMPNNAIAQQVNQGFLDLPLYSCSVSRDRMSANGRSRNSPGIIVEEQVALNLSPVNWHRMRHRLHAIALCIIDLMS